MYKVLCAFLLSRPVRGAWIEIASSPSVVANALTSRAPYGARGLKYRLGGFGVKAKESRPVRGAWIEINIEFLTHANPESRPVRGAWIEICLAGSGGRAGQRSRPVRGAWIEIVTLVENRIIEIGRAPYGARGLKCLLRELWHTPD